MLQKIVSICSIGSFLAAIYIIFAGNLEWQWYSLLGIGLFFIIVALVDRKHRLVQPGKIMTLEGIQPLPYSPDKKIEIEVFYPKTFKHSPNLTIQFQNASGLPRGRPRGGSAVNTRPYYKTTEQRPDGFKCEIYELPSRYKPIIKWKAKGEFVAKDKNISPQETGKGI